MLKSLLGKPWLLVKQTDVNHYEANCINRFVTQIDQLVERLLIRQLTSCVTRKEQNTCQLMKAAKQAECRYYTQSVEAQPCLLHLLLLHLLSCLLTALYMVAYMQANKQGKKGSIQHISKLTSQRQLPSIDARSMANNHSKDADRLAVLPSYRELLVQC